MTRGTTRDGAITDERSSACTQSGEVLQIDATSSARSPQWGLYIFSSLPSDAELLNLYVDASVTAGTEYWLALGDFSSLRWQLEGPYTEASTVALNTAKMVSPGRQFWCAVVLPAGNAAEVRSLHLRLDTSQNLPPQAFFSPSEISGTPPLNVHFDASASIVLPDEDDSIVQYAWDWENDGVIDLKTDSPQVEHIYTQSGDYLVRLVVKDEGGSKGEAGGLVSCNIPPIAQVAGPATAEQGADVVLDASASIDPDGSLGDFAYDWDMDGDGVFELTNEPAQLHYAFGQLGTQIYSVRVEDNKGATDVASRSIEIFSGWDGSETLESENYTGTYSNMLLVDGCPAIAFHESTNHDLRYIRALDATGSQWGPSVLVDGLGMCGVELSMAIIDGRPAISYGEVFDGVLRYVRAADADGESWAAPQAIDFTGYSGRVSSLAEVDGRPAVSFSRLAAQVLYLRAEDADGTAWGTPVPLDNRGDFAGSTSLLVVDGAPAVAYISEEELRFSRALDADGTAWAAPQMVYGTSGNDGGCSLQLVDGRPAIAFNGNSSDGLCFIQSLDAQGASWDNVHRLDTQAGLGTDCCLRVLNGEPTITYQSVSSGDLYMLVRGPLGWQVPQQLASIGDVGQYSSLLESGGVQLISYFDADQGDLKLLRKLQ